MANIEINVAENGTTTLATAGKYCDRNIDVVVEVAGSGEEYFTDEELVFTGNCSYLFSYDKWKSVLEKESDRISIKNVSSIVSMFQNCNAEDLSFLTIEGDGKTPTPAGNLFAYMPNIKKLPTLKNVVINANQCNGLFSDNYYFTDVDELIKLFDSITFSNTTLQSLAFFSYCYSLRNIDAVMPYLSKAFANYKSGAAYGSFCNRCTALDELNNIPVLGGNKDYNGFNNIFSSLYRVKNITFETNNGEPIVANWKAQTIDMSNAVGYTANYSSSYLFDYNAGITTATEVREDNYVTNYHELKNNPDWWTGNINYSRFNHDSAVNTINSLPDTSAYLAEKGGTNTIKFKATSGAKTDGGAINTLTEEEIAVAAAKGWTVTFV